VILIELFTSQGCATCPEAERLLGRLEEQARGAVVGLAYHVDSFDHLGWRDPFGSAEWSRRHGRYALARGTDAYTPQAVVDGGASVPGGDFGALRPLLVGAARRPAGRLEVRATLEADGTARLAVDAALPAELASARLDLMVAVRESALETPVRRGENAGRSLREDRVVRQLKRVARLGEGAPGGRFETGIRLSDGWNRAELEFAVFLQDPRDLSIHGAAIAALEHRPPGAQPSGGSKSPN
jgi:hypothetical protein